MDVNQKIMVSACLFGEKCRYNGKIVLNKELVDKLKNNQVILCCPEILGGLSIPRVSCNIRGGDGFDVLVGQAKVIGNDNKEYSQEFIKGAELALELAVQNDIKTAYLKQNSPSCGCGKIYSKDGKTLVDGSGVFAALLKQNNINVIPI